ncbi:MAG: Na+/H+ antiporter NhaA [Solimonas sp.]
MQTDADRRHPLSPLLDFLRQESSAGIVLMAAAALALLVANSPLAGAYFDVQHRYVGGLSVLHWINDGLMALFFLIVGLEIKREMLQGQLASWPLRVLPGIAAFGGMLVPALIYVGFTYEDRSLLSGWAIPTATDIAFALGVLALLGPRVPPSLKVFLAALAIIDDLGAVLVIAVFYTAQLHVGALLGAAAVLAVLAALNRFGVTRLAFYLPIGALLWFLVLKSGVHATLAGVMLALTIPLRTQGEANSSPLHRLEHGLHPWVAFAVVPLFGFANAGLSFSGMSAETLLAPVTLGIAIGLFVGKQIGVFGFAWVAVKSGKARLPAQSNWRQLFGVALLCGIGFTMSLFIGGLAFATAPELMNETKLGVLCGSLVSALGGVALLLSSSRKAA